MLTIAPAIDTEELTKAFVGSISVADRLGSGIQLATLAALRHLAVLQNKEGLWQQVRNNAVHYGSPAAISEAVSRTATEIESGYSDAAGLFTEVLVGNILQCGGALPSFVAIIDRFRFPHDPAAFASWFDAVISELSDGPKVHEIATPRPLARLLASLSRLDRTKTCFDPCCGMGTLLSQAFKVSPQTHFYGQELNALAAAVARLRLFLLGADATIVSGDALHAPLKTDEGPRTYDVTLCDTPGGQLSKSDIPLELRWVGTARLESLFLAHCLESLRTNGRAVVLIPYSFLLRGNDRATRRHLLSRGELEVVIGLPVGVVPWTTAKFAILVLRKFSASTAPVRFVNGETLFTLDRRTAERFSDSQADMLADICLAKAPDSRSVVEVPISALLSHEEIDLQPARFINSPETVDFNFAQRHHDAKQAEAEADRAREILDDLLNRLP